MTTDPPATAEDYRLSRMKVLHAMLITVFDHRERADRMSTPLEMVADMVIELAKLSIADLEERQAASRRVY